MVGKWWSQGGAGWEVLPQQAGTITRKETKGYVPTKSQIHSVSMLKNPFTTHEAIKHQVG
jgi:hypothetical protein